MVTNSFVLFLSKIVKADLVSLTQKDTTIYLDHVIGNIKREVVQEMTTFVGYRRV